MHRRLARVKRAWLRAVGKNISEMAKIIGITPAVFTRNGKKLRRPPAIPTPDR